MLDVLKGFVTELRAAGLPVSLTESIDAADAVGHIPLEDREALKYALAATLVKSSTHWRAFDTAFEVYFSMRGEGFAIDADHTDDSNALELEAFEDPMMQGKGRRGGGGGGEALTPEELAELLYRALQAPTDARLAALSRYVVTRFAGMEPGRPVGGTYYLYRTLRNLDLDGVLERLVDEARQAAPGGELTALEERLERDEAKAAIDRFRGEVEAEIRRRLVADRGAEALARSIRKPLPEDVDFMHATREELATLRRVIQPLTRKLAVRLARKRRHGRRGPLDFRSTMRHSLSTGGVPMDPKFRFPRPSKPEIFVVADISGSVAAFARIHAPTGARDQLAVLEGAELRLRRRDRRGHPVLRRRRRRDGRDSQGEHRGRRGLGGRALRLWPCAKGVLGALGRGGEPPHERAAARRRVEQLPRL